METSEKYNVPLYGVMTNTVKGVAHKIQNYLFGKNAKKFKNWYLVEPQDDSKAVQFPQFDCEGFSQDPEIDFSGIEKIVD